mgnify:CR=1 FL=1
MLAWSDRSFQPQHWSNDEMSTTPTLGYDPTPAGVPVDFDCAWRSYAFEYAQKIQPNVDTTELQCASPVVNFVAPVTVEVSLNAQQYTDDGATFTYYPPFTTDDVRPVSSPLRGGTVVTLRGSGFQDFPTLQCKFGDAAAQPFPSTPTP